MPVHGVVTVLTIAAIALLFVAMAAAFRRQLSRSRSQQDQLSSRANELERIVDAIRGIAASPNDLDATLQTIAYHAAKLTGAHGTTVSMIEGDTLVCRAAIGIAERFIGNSISVSSALSARALLEGRALRIDDTRREAGSAREHLAPIGILSFVAVPLNHQGRQVALLAAMSRTAGAFDSETTALLELVAGTGATAIARSLEVENSVRQERRFRALTERSTDLVSVIGEDGTVTYFNEAVERILGYRPSELVGKPSLSIVDPEDIPAATALLASAMEGPGAAVRGLVRMPHRDGRRVILEIEALNLTDLADVEGIVVNARDVTERESASEMTRFQAHLLDAVQQAVMATDAEGHIIYWSRSAAATYGWSAAEAMGRNVFDLLSPFGEADQMRVRFNDVVGILGQQHSIRRESTVKRKDGRPRLVSTSVTALRDAAGRVVGVVGVSEDISEHRALEEQLRQSQKMEAVGRLAGGIAHDFNNLLTIIRANTDFLVEALAGQPERVKELTEIQQASIRAATLTRQLLAYSRQQVLQPRVVDVDAHVHEVLALVRRVIGDDIRIEVESSPQKRFVLVDPGQLEQVVMNLVVNARDAMPGGGVITLRTSTATLVPDDAADGASLPSDYVVLSVTDTGKGMDEETLARIFEPFFTTKGPGKGTGLGLSMVDGIVKQSGGFVRVKSAPGAGARFDVYLPAVAATSAVMKHPVEAPTREALPSTPTASPSATVLLAEDEDVLRALLVRVLLRCGFEVLEASDGREALALATTHASQLQLIITDSSMPYLGGAALAARLAEQGVEVPVVLMSGFADVDSLESGGRFASFLPKPFTPHELVKVVQSVLAGAS